MRPERTRQRDASDHEQDEQQVLADHREALLAQVPDQETKRRHQHEGLQQAEPRRAEVHEGGSHHDLGQPFVIDPDAVAGERISVDARDRAISKDVGTEQHVAPQVGIGHRYCEQPAHNRPDDQAWDQEGVEGGAGGAGIGGSSGVGHRLGILYEPELLPLFCRLASGVDSQAQLAARTNWGMAPNTISIARVLQLGVPIAWQEAVEVARAAESAAERRARRLTVEGCMISTAGTVEVGTNGTDRLGADLTALQLLAILIDGQQAPAELRALAATAEDALSSFPSESKSAADQPLSLDWFVHPNPEVEIASLATRALEAAAPPVEPNRIAPRPRPHPLGGDRSAPMTFERPADRRTQAPIEEVVRPVPEHHAEPPSPVAERRVEPPKPAAPERSAERRPPPVVEAARPVAAPPPPEPPVEPPKPAAAARRAEPPKPAAPERSAERRPQPPLVEAARAAQVPPVPERRAEPPRAAAAARSTEPPKPAVSERPTERPSVAVAKPRVEPPTPAVTERRVDSKPAATAPTAVRLDPSAARPEPVVAERRVVRPETAVTERVRERLDPATVVAQLRAEVLHLPVAPGGTDLQVRPVTRAMSHQFTAVIEKGRSVGVVPLAVMALAVVVAAGFATWALFLPGLPAQLTFRSLGPLVPLARTFEPNLPTDVRITAGRGISMASVGTTGTAGSLRVAEGNRLARAEASVPFAPPESAPAATSPSFTAPSNAAPIAMAAAAPPPTSLSPSPAGRVVAKALGAAPSDRRVYTADDADVEPPTMRRPQLQQEPRADTEPSDSYVEVVVDERGEVTRVRLRSTDLSLNDRMIVAAAKAWQFEPAMKDGHPVKYVLRLPVTR